MGAEERLAGLKRSMSDDTMEFAVVLMPHLGGHTCGAYNKTLTVNYQPGATRLEAAEAVFFAKPYPPPVRDPTYIKLAPGTKAFRYPDTHYGAGVTWTYGSGASGTGTFSWNFAGFPECPNGWSMVDRVNSQSSVNVQIACSPAGRTWDFSYRTSTRQPPYTATLVADGKPVGTLGKGSETRTVEGATISIEFEVRFQSVYDDLTFLYQIWPKG